MRGAPVFIVGCGRSGTTALGRLLGAHPDVVYLNEPRPLWRLDPRTDVWSGSVPEARVDLDDVDPGTRARLRKAFFAKAPGDRVLVEKTPINSFRIDYLRAVFPRARFLHLLRSGLDVARSIERWCASGQRWYGDGDSKWRLLSDYAARHGLGELAGWAGDDPRRRGLVEWRLAVEHARPRLSPDDLEIRYEMLVEDAGPSAQSVLGWVGLDGAEVEDAPLARRTEPEREIDGDAEHAAGALLRSLGYP